MKKKKSKQRSSKLVCFDWLVTVSKNSSRLMTDKHENHFDVTRTKITKKKK